MEPSYETIQPLIAAQEVRGSSVHCVFRCPLGGAEVEASAGIRRLQDVKNVAARSIKQSLFGSLRSAVSRTLSDVLGGGVAGRVGRDVSSQLLRNAQQGSRHTSDEVEAAVVAAFTRVAKQFRWDGERWVGAGSAPGAPEPTPFETQLQAAPVANAYDRGILARVLVAVAAVDGELAEEERAFLGDFLDPSLGTVDQLLERRRVSPVELDETSAGGARETILMLAWTLALSDEQLARAEHAALASLARGFGLGDARAAELRDHAQGFLFQQALDRVYASGQRDEEAHRVARELAAGIGLSAEAAERADIRYRKARGLA